VVSQRRHTSSKMPVTFDAHSSYCTLPFDSWQLTQSGKETTDTVAALSLRMAEASGFPRKGCV
jgi:hypothetical protein